MGIFIRLLLTSEEVSSRRELNIHNYGRLVLISQNDRHSFLVAFEYHFDHDTRLFRLIYYLATA